jgi:hypothetical protein
LISSIKQDGILEHKGHEWRMPTATLIDVEEDGAKKWLRLQFAY